MYSGQTNSPSRDKLIRRLTIAVILLLVSAAIVIITWSVSHKTFNKENLAVLNTLEESKVEDGLPVRGTIDLAFDIMAEEYETTNGMRSSDNSSKLYYIVPVFEADDEGYITVNYLLVYESLPLNFDVMDKILEQTYVEPEEWTTLELDSAIIRKLPADLEGYLNEWKSNESYYDNGSFVDWCIENQVFGTDDAAAVSDKIKPYMITDTSGSLTLVWVLVPIAAVLLIVLLVLRRIKKPAPAGEVNPDTTDAASSEKISE